MALRSCLTIIRSKTGALLTTILSRTTTMQSACLVHPDRPAICAENGSTVEMSLRGHAARTFQHLRTKCRIFRRYFATLRNRLDIILIRTLPLQSVRRTRIQMALLGRLVLIVGFVPHTV